ncbi:hypothetical protein F4808DRAFT_455755 [Astrocystis sublimbata]|nr:hypothetical protein F4808DRAFT_455755 [Astrocystis sublimbata]
MAAQKLSAQPAWAHADDESLDLIFSLLREDAIQLKSSSKGKETEGILSDVEIAAQLYGDDLKRATTYVSDRGIAKSMQEAVQTDADAILEHEQVERVARSDRHIAIARPAGRVQTQNQRHTNPDPLVAGETPELLNKLRSIYVTGTDNATSDASSDGTTKAWSLTTGNNSESSSWGASREPETIPQRSCVACGDMKHFVDLAQAPCRHEYCRECLDHLFRSAMLDESLFPPRCCRQVIPVEAARMILESDFIQQFEEKSIELSTINRIYCHQPACSAFIPTPTIHDGVAQCPECDAQTCVTCKAEMHKGDCPADEALQQVLEVAQQEGWQRCPECNTLIELDIGCYHMTVKLSSVISAQQDGKLANVNTGMKTNYWREPEK